MDVSGWARIVIDRCCPYPQKDDFAGVALLVGFVLVVEDVLLLLALLFVVAVLVGGALSIG